ncbi:MAG: tyrosine--tRNA ligase [bacterium]|nr:tyrosine--tRNA ligase [bacterium]
MDDILTRGVEAVLPNREALTKRLTAGPIKLFMGVDATGPNLHLGHLASLLKLRDFQQAGHLVIVLLGDFTTQIGDPTDKLAARRVMTLDEVEANIKDYERQVLLILDKTKTIFRRNGEWFNKMSVQDFLNLATEFTDKDLTDRDMFVERKKQGKPVYANELFYPLLQGYDSVALGVDLEVGGNDQIFNMLAGRDLMSHRGREKFVLATKLLIDPTGKKMGKTEGNMANLDDSPSELFGKIMSWTDEMMPLGFEILTRLPAKEYQEILAGHPKEAKLALAEEIVKLIHSDDKAKGAKDSFESTFSTGEAVEPIIISTIAGAKLGEVLVANKLVKSKSDFRRLVEQGAVELGGDKITDSDYILNQNISGRIGAHRFIKIELN